MPDNRPAPPECANCGAAIPPGARACPECGADERTGWREASIYDGIDLPEEAFEAREKQTVRTRRNVNGVPWYWWSVGVVILLLFAFGVLALL
jgi:hypothetical protein